MMRLYFARSLASFLTFAFPLFLMSDILLHTLLGNGDDDGTSNDDGDTDFDTDDFDDEEETDELGDEADDDGDNGLNDDDL